MVVVLHVSLSACGGLVGCGVSQFHFKSSTGLPLASRGDRGGGWHGDGGGGDSWRNMVVQKEVDDLMTDMVAELIALTTIAVEVVLMITAVDMMTGFQAIGMEAIRHHESPSCLSFFPIVNLNAMFFLKKYKHLSTYYSCALLPTLPLSTTRVAFPLTMALFMKKTKNDRLDFSTKIDKTNKPPCYSLQLVTN